MIWLLGFAGGYGFTMDWRVSIVTSVIGCVAGTLIVRHFKIVDRLKIWAKVQKDFSPDKQ
jgi:uncharacterized membrane-anchored protein YhcB (DUF1043 family)